jgi:hypothetical protein
MIFDDKPCFTRQTKHSRVPIVTECPIRGIHQLDLRGPHNEGVLVVFSDNKTILFRTDFCIETLQDNGNEDYTDTADMLD